MKKLALIISIIWISIYLVACSKQNNSQINEFKWCTDNNWNPESRFDWSGNFDVCYFNDESFCFLEDLNKWECKKWEHYYGDEDYYNDAFETFEEFSENRNNEENENNNENENINSDDNITQKIAECDKMGEDITCWKDWNTYYNKCYLEFAWVEEETQLAEVIDWECVFG